MENVTMNGTQQAVAMAKAAGLKATFVDTRLACVGARIHQVSASKRTPGAIFVRKSSFAKTGSGRAEGHFQRKGASTRPPTPSTAAMAALGTPVSKATAGFMKLVRNGLLLSGFRRLPPACFLCMENECACHDKLRKQKAN